MLVAVQSAEKEGFSYPVYDLTFKSTDEQAAAQGALEKTPFVVTSGEGYLTVAATGLLPFDKYLGVIADAFTAAGLTFERQ